MTARPRLLSDAELLARAAELARVADHDEADALAQTGLLVATLGGEYLGIDVSQVREVIGDPQVTPLPMAPSYIAGVTNVRGEIIGVIDLSQLLSLPAAATSAAVVVHHDGVSAALRVGRVDAVAWFATSLREPVAATMAAAESQLLNGAFRSGITLITALNIPEILALPQRESVEATRR